MDERVWHIADGIYLMLCRTFSAARVAHDNGCLEWIAELLKWAATP